MFETSLAAGEKSASWHHHEVAFLSIHNSSQHTHTPKDINFAQANVWMKHYYPQQMHVPSSSYEEMAPTFPALLIFCEWLKTVYACKMEHEQQCGMGSGTCVISLLIFLSSPLRKSNFEAKRSSSKFFISNTRTMLPCYKHVDAMDRKSVLVGILRQVISDSLFNLLKSMKK